MMNNSFPDINKVYPLSICKNISGHKIYSYNSIAYKKSAYVHHVQGAGQLKVILLPNMYYSRVV